MALCHRWVIPDFEKKAAEKRTSEIKSGIFSIPIMPTHGSFHLILEWLENDIIIRIHSNAISNMELDENLKFYILLGFFNRSGDTTSDKFPCLLATYDIHSIPKEKWNDQGICDGSLVITLFIDFQDDSRHLGVPTYLHDLMLDETSSDITIKLVDGEIKTHKNILLIASRVLRENISDEGILDLTNDNHVCQLFRTFLEYCTNIDLTCEYAIENGISQLLDMYQLAIQYGVLYLEIQIAIKILYLLTPDTVIDVLIVSYNCKRQVIVNECIQMIAAIGVEKLPNWNKLEEHRSVFFYTTTSLLTRKPEDAERYSEFAMKPGTYKPYPTIRNELLKIYDSKIDTNVVITCSDDKHINAHKDILSIRSAVFRDLLLSRELNIREITISQYDSVTIDRLLVYMYACVYIPGNFDADVELFKAANEYQVEILTKSISSQIQELINSSNLHKAVELISLYHDSTIQDSCIEILTISETKDIMNCENVLRHPDMMRAFLKQRDELLKLHKI